jgi:hypothetical protein
MGFDIRAGALLAGYGLAAALLSLAWRARRRA